MDKIYLDKTCTKIIEPSIDSVEIDKPIARLIILLNRKEYKTLFSCSGHDNSKPYLSFMHDAKTEELCNHVFDRLSNNHKDERINIRIAMLGDIKTISIYPDKSNSVKWLDNITKAITSYLLVNDEWLKNKIEFAKNYPFEQEFLNQWTTPTKTE
jgi:hypothetical protein